MRELPKILFVAATESDALQFTTRLENSRTYKQKVGLVHGGIWHYTSAKCLITGHNPDATAAALREAIQVDKPLAVVSIGFGSALASALNVGDVVVGTQFLDAIGMGSQYRPVTMPSPVQEMMRRVLRSVPGIHGTLGSIVTVYDPVREPSEKMALYVKTQADVVDQSAIAIANIAEEAKIPFVVVRSIFDISDEKVPELERHVRQEAKLSTTRMIARLAVNPARVFALRDLLSRARLCRERLEVFTEAFWNALMEGKSHADMRAESTGSDVVKPGGAQWR
jgi:adenosylhomocysteine nucleosidase